MSVCFPKPILILLSFNVDTTAKKKFKKKKEKERSMSKRTDVGDAHKGGKIKSV